MSGADQPVFRGDMRAWMSRNQSERPLRTQTTAASDVRHGDPDEDSAGTRCSGVEKEATTAVDEPVVPTLVSDEAPRSCSRPSRQGSSDSLHSSQVPPDPEAARSQPGCSVSTEHEACTVWPTPLLESTAESPETSAPGSADFLPFFGVRNISNFNKKHSKRNLFRRRSSDDVSESETEDIELDVLKWETYESSHEEPQKYKSRIAMPHGCSQRPYSDVNQKMKTCTACDIATYEPPADSFALELELVRLTNELSPHSPADDQGDEHSDEDEAVRDRGLWSTLFDGRTRRLSLDVMSADEIEIDEKVAAWDPSQEDNYALQSPGELELYDLEIADPRDGQASQKPAAFRACTDHAVDRTVSQSFKKALPSATPDHGLYDDLKWMFEESDKSEDEPNRGILAEPRMKKRRLELVECPDEAGALEVRSVGTHSKADCLDDTPASEALVAAPRSGGSVIARAGGIVAVVEDLAKTEDEVLLDEAALRAPASKRRKKRRKHGKRKSHQKKRLAKIKKKERKAAAARKETHVESKGESPGTTAGTSAVRQLLPRTHTELALEWGLSCSLSGVGSGLHASEFQDDEVQIQDTGDVTICIRTSTRTKAAMLWPFGPPAD
ncbi:hypothetical protein HPB49_023807 [Dermacentor silvarum]|uniref:Uncharacterized protein n=1 Tax=Dermacentor silvarum TaxID=543639 RepID=A0ACB8DH10_DERSI|nr:hypothetical protein HPB49_023807 [Dermacentor silvarum]